MNIAKLVLISGLFLGLAAGAQAPAPAPLPEEKPESVSFEGRGSFHAHGEGDIEFSMNGTLLLTDVEASEFVVTGLKVERGPESRKIGDKNQTRLVFHGEGTVRIKNGKFRTVIFFGKQCKGSFNGKGFVRVTGVGTYQRADGVKGEWYEGLMAIVDTTPGIYVPGSGKEPPKPSPGSPGAPSAPGGPVEPGMQPMPSEPIEPHAEDGHNH